MVHYFYRVIPIRIPRPQERPLDARKRQWTFTSDPDGGRLVTPSLLWSQNTSMRQLPQGLLIFVTPLKTNMEPTNHPFRKEHDFPNLHDYVPC